MPRFYKIKCSPELIENFSSEDKERIQEIELINQNKKIPKNSLKQFTMYKMWDFIKMRILAH